VGHAGYTVIAVRNGQHIWDPLQTVSPRGATAIAAARYATDSVSDSLPELVTANYVELDTNRIATVAAFAASPLVVISSASVEEFADSFAQVRATNLALALLLTGALAVAFIVVTRRTTRPLETLTAAAAEVGRGNFLPKLPPAGDDEIGRLTSAFAAMSSHVDRMMKELETSRQMAAVGSFARQIAHEIRNPLTSIKLNLQSLERDVRGGIVPDDGRRTMEICLEEIHRLDRVVRGVLKLGRERSNGQHLTTAEAVVERALGIVRPQLEQQRITLTYEPHGALPIVADEERLVGAFLNLFVNAAEAMPEGGQLRVTVSRADGGKPGASAIITIADTGAGIPRQARSSVFEPFFTTKTEGSGLGLAVALRDAEAHRGNIALLDTNGTPGATFVVELPLADEAPE
jgi:signal transduction histidine kinase